MEPEEKLPEWAELEQRASWLQRRDWELWSIALLLITVFGAGLLAYVYSQKNIALTSPAATRFVWLMLFGLAALVVLLNAYLIDRKRSLVNLTRHYWLQAQELEQEREQAMRDPLTHVFNRRFFDEALPKEIHRCDRLGRPLSFLLVDLDDFKEVNQRLGHFSGDQILKAVAGVLQDCLRASDLLFRFGGDEFLIVLPETPHEGAAILEGRLLQFLSERKDIHERVGRPLTVTIGRATYARGKSLESVVDEAEQTLEAIRAGRRGE